MFVGTVGSFYLTASLYCRQNNML